MSGSKRVNARRHEAGTQIRNFNHGERRTRSQKRVWKTACEWGTEKGSRAEAQGRGGRNTKECLTWFLFAEIHAIRRPVRENLLFEFLAPPVGVRPTLGAVDHCGKAGELLVSHGAELVHPSADRGEAGAVGDEGLLAPRFEVLNKARFWQGLCGQGKRRR